MGEWKEVKLVDLASRITKGTTPSTIGGAFLSSGINFIKSESVSYDGKIDKSTFAYISEDTHNKLKRSQLERNDILFSMAGIYLGKSGFVTEDILPANTNQALAIIKIDPNKAFPKYIHFVLRQKSVIEYVNTISGQSAQPNINMEEIGSIELLLPPLTEQERIAEVLDSLDDKIDLLNRQNKTLEEMAETLFRQWFVEEAKDDWEAGLFSDLVTVKYGKDHQKLVEGIIPAYGSGGIMRMVDKALYEKESVLIPRKGTLSNIIYINKPFWTVDTMFFTEMKRNNIAKFIYHFIKEQDLGSMNVGSAVPSMTTEILNNLPITIPPENVLDRFEGEATYFYKKIDSNKNQIQQLETLRDTLLPKLMSGLVTVNEIA